MKQVLLKQDMVIQRIRLNKILNVNKINSVRNV
jgi:hypothetical protein